METFVPEELESDILHDLIDEIDELYEASEQTLIELELTPKDNDLQRALFRHVHTIKGDLGLVGFTPMILVLQHLEDLLDMLRKGQICYTSNMSDLVLVGMDRVKQFVASIAKDEKAEYDDQANQRVIDVISTITADNQSEHESLLAKATASFDPNYTDNDESQASDEQLPTMSRVGVPKDLSPEQQIDVLFFRELMKPIEKRAGYKEGRGDRIAKLACYINEIAGKPIPESQLCVACYVHDFGMAFLPAEIVQKRTTLNDMEKNLLRSHVYKSARLLENLTQWDLARKMVMEHHEYIDGSGSPLGLESDKICDGAKLLAILDKFDGLLQGDEKEGTDPLPMKEAIITINKKI